MDGTLVDTEPYWIAAETPLVERFGGTWTHEDALRLVGLGLEDAARIFQGAGVRMSVHEIVQFLTDEVMRQLRDEGVPFRPGARELLESLREAGIRTALVTMSLSRMATSIVDLIDFDAFDVVIGGDDVTRPKPFPDPYLQACDALGIAPADAVAIEDSPNGLRAALAADIASIGVPNIVPLTGVGAHAIWPSLEGRSAADVSAFHAAHAASRRGA
jgi:HAD superfamily hydrolase (TIGR01509 family)